MDYSKSGNAGTGKGTPKFDAQGRGTPKAAKGTKVETKAELLARMKAAAEARKK